MLINTEHNMSMVEEWGDGIIDRGLFGMFVAGWRDVKIQDCLVILFSPENIPRHRIHDTENT